MAYVQQVSEEQASGPLKRIYDAAKHGAGKVAKIIKVMSLDHRSLGSSMQFYTSLMKAKNPLISA